MNKYELIEVLAPDHRLPAKAVASLMITIVETMTIAW